MRFCAKSGRLGNLAIHLVGAIVLLCSAGFACAMQDDQDQSGKAAARADEGAALKQQIDELGVTLRAAVMAGTLTGEEAREIYKVMMTSIKEDWEASNASRAKPAAKKPEEESPKRSVLRLSPARPGQIRALFQPEFRTRDLAVLRNELDLDLNQMMIAEMLLRDYLEAVDLASSPLREALGRYQSATRDQWLAAALQRTDDSLADALQRAKRTEPDDAVRRMKRRMRRIEREGNGRIEAADEKDRRKFRAWQRRMIEATGELDDRLATIRRRVSGELAEMDREDVTITADDLVRMARQLRAERAQLREDVTVGIEMITNDKQKGAENARFEAVFARIQLDHLLPQGRLGGESMNLWAAMTETGRGREEPIDIAESMLRGHAKSVAEQLDGRTEAAIDRELQGLEFLAMRDRIAAANGQTVREVDQARLVSARQPYTEAARREVAASVAVRDALRTLLDESSTYLNDLYPDAGLSAIYREASLRRGFPNEMRRRWSERAVAAALELDGLDDDTREALLAIDAANRDELAMLRADAIARCIARDPQLARDIIDGELAGGRKMEWVPEMWLGINYEAFDAIDVRTENQLRGILPPDQVEQLPVLKRAEAAKKEPKQNGKGKAQGGKKRG